MLIAQKMYAMSFSVSLCMYECSQMKPACPVCILVIHNEDVKYNQLGPVSKAGLLNYGMITLNMGQEFHVLHNIVIQLMSSILLHEKTILLQMGCGVYLYQPETVTHILASQMKSENK